MPTKLFFESEKRNTRRFLWWAPDDARLNDLDDWFEKLEPPDKNKLLNLLNVMSSTTGLKLHISDKKYKHEFDKISAIKSFQIRLYGLIKGKDFIILHYIIKKTDRMNAKDKDIIKKKYNRYMETQGKG